VAILDGGFTSIHDITSTSQLRKQWPFPDGLAKGSNRPFPNIPVGQKRSARLAKCLRMAGHNALGGAVVEPQKNEPNLVETLVGVHFEIIDQALQIFGGLGVVRGSTVERLFRHSRAFRIFDGTSEIQQLIIARQVLQNR